MTAHQRTTRLAPSPTGALHLGNARTFLINWALARASGWRIALRIEDLDGPRVKIGADAQAIQDLAWLGMDWDEGPYTQRGDLTPYQSALSRLWAGNHIYACTCTRGDIEAARSAPNLGDHDLRYPGTCRHKNITPDAATAWRVVVPDEAVTVHDQFAGAFSENIQAVVGDFVVATKAQLPAYQLAVVVDDARQGVSDVVRGDDLLSSAARQMLLYRLLGLTPIPRYWHVPLVLGADGRRLAKRHGDSRIATYREQGVAPERIIGLIAAWCGVIPSPSPMTAGAFAASFDIAALPHGPVTFLPEDHRWLCAGAH